LIAGQPIEKLRTKISSGQMWGLTPYSQQQGLAGYIDWAAGGVKGAPASYRDYLGEMSRMQPKTPYSFQYWRPIRQRA